MIFFNRLISLFADGSPTFLQMECDEDMPDEATSESAQCCEIPTDPMEIAHLNFFQSDEGCCAVRHSDWDPNVRGRPLVCSMVLNASRPCQQSLLPFSPTVIDKSKLIQYAF